MKPVVPFSLLLLYTSNAAIATPDSMPGVDLWLPKKFQPLYTDLVAIAKRVKAEPGCWKLLSGTIAEEKSTLEHPVYTFRCRNEHKRSFSYQVDGIDKLIVNTHEKMQEIRRKKRIETLKTRYWAICEPKIQTKLERFDANVLTDMPPEPKVRGDKKLEFQVDFDSRNSANKLLKYRVVCTVNSGSDYKVRVRPRK